MRFLGIDYGSKKVGLALSDSDGLLAFPFAIYPNNISLIDSIEKLINDEKVDRVVMGASYNNAGQANEVMTEIENFVKELGERTAKIVLYEKEFWTSQEAHRSVDGFLGKEVFNSRKRGQPQSQTQSKTQSKYNQPNKSRASQKSQGSSNKNQSSQISQKTDDDRAAALILQRYIDRLNKQEEKYGHQ